MSILGRLFGGKRGPEEPGQSGAVSPAKRELQRQRQNTESCLTMLSRCRTREEIVRGFGEIASLLRSANDPLADAAEKASIGCGALPDEYVLRLRDDFISECRAFMSATERGLREL
jgi:hypothetical protein